MNDASTKSTLSISVRTLAVLLGGLAMFGPFSIDTIFPAFPAIGAQFGADKAAMQQTISVYLVAYAAMSIVHGPLSDAIVAHLQAHGVRIGEFGVRYGAEGEGPSQYLLDPEGNMVELKGPPDEVPIDTASSTGGT